MSDSPVQKAEQLLQEAERILALPLPARTAEQVLEFRRLAKGLQDLRDHHQGFRDRAHEFTKLVAGLFVLMRETSPGRWHPRATSVEEHQDILRKIAEFLKDAIREAHEARTAAPRAAPGH